MINERDYSCSTRTWPASIGSKREEARTCVCSTTGNHFDILCVQRTKPKDYTTRSKQSEESNLKHSRNLSVGGSLATQVPRPLLLNVCLFGSLEQYQNMYINWLPFRLFSILYKHFNFIVQYQRPI